MEKKTERCRGGTPAKISRRMKSFTVMEVRGGWKDAKMQNRSSSGTATHSFATE